MNFARCSICRDTEPIKPKCKVCGKEDQMLTFTARKEKGASMSTDPQIKTGLKLSEAIKLLEENEGAMIKPDASLSFHDDINFWEFDLKLTYSVKLPPPKSVSVTKDAIRKAISNNTHLMKFAYLDEAIDAVCKELGL